MNKFCYLIVFCASLSGCVKSCVQTKDKKTETWELYVQSMNPGDTGLSGEKVDLVLSAEVLTLRQQGKDVEFEVVNWDKADFAKLRYKESIGYFKWEVFPGGKRTLDQEIACQGSEEAGILRIEETQQVKTVTLSFEDEKTRTPQFHLQADVPNGSLWVKTGTNPVKPCPPVNSPTEAAK